ncbi:hypothetical protein X777_10666 [Ooceraea biroi]|nr:hypothetical protein X777_10666 [Ooceraea biroi]
MFRGRNILNLGSNIRLPFWQLREQTLTHQDYQNFVANRRTCHQLRDQALTNDYPTRCCKECGFYTPSPII